MALAKSWKNRGEVPVSNIARFLHVTGVTGSCLQARCTFEGKGGGWVSGTEHCIATRLRPSTNCIQYPGRYDEGFPSSLWLGGATHLFRLRPTI